jgi:hypothetical protein
MFRSAQTGSISLAGKDHLTTSKLETTSPNIGTVGFSIQVHLFLTCCMEDVKY